MLDDESQKLRLEIVIENAHHAIVVTDRKGLVQLANPAVTRLTGFDHKSLIGRRLEYLVPEKHREAHSGYVEGYLHGSHSEILTKGRVIQVQHVNGRKVPVFIRVHETVTERDHFFTAIMEDLSTETLLQDRLDEGARMLRVMADSNPSGIFISDETGTRNVYVNEELCRIYGATAGELLLAGAWQHFIHPEDAPTVLAAMRDATTGPNGSEVVHRVVNKSGRVSWVHVSVRPYHQEGKFSGFIGSVLDITAYKNAELEIEAERSRMYEITRMLPASVKYFDAEGRYIFVNAAVERTWKKPLEEFVGRHYSEILPAEMLSTVEPYMRRAFGGEEVRFELSLPGQGKPRRFQTTYVPHKRNGQVIGMTASAIDMTDIQEKSDRLQIYEQMIEGMSEGVALAGRDVPETIFYSNPAFARILGRQSFEILGYSIARFIADLADPFAFSRSLRLELETQGTFRSEVTLLDKDGRRVDVVLKARPLDLPDARAILYSIADVSSLKEAERLAQAERDRATLATAAKSRFIAHVSHEIRNPLNAMLGYTELLLHREAEIPAAMREMLSHIQSAGRGLLRLVGEVLDLEQIEAGKMSVRSEAFSLRELLAELESTMRYRCLLHSLSFEMKLSEELPEFVHLDRTRLYQILLNLTSNAAKYAPRGSKVCLEVSAERRDLHIHVVDQGPGVPKEFEDKLFTAFSRAVPEDGSVKGTGLGLFISRQLAQLMGGSLEYERPPEGGTIFCLRLPLVPADLVPHSIHSSSPARFEGVRALVVDDSDLNRTVLVAILELAGCQAWSAASGELALEMAEEISPNVCFVDYHMPGMNGGRTIEALRNCGRCPDLKSVLLSGDVFEDQLKSTSLADYFLLKPYERNDIFRILRDAFPASGG